MNLNAMSKKDLLAACELFAKEIGAERSRTLLDTVFKEKAARLLAGSNVPTSVLESSPPTATSSGQVELTLDQEKSHKKPRTTFDFSKYHTRQIALWIGYFGGKYLGLCTAGQPKEDKPDETVEWYLFRALKRVKLIEPDGSLESWKYSRCGRTDRGVSGLGQVVSIKVRSTGEAEEMDYSLMLNSNLPEDIIVLAWAPVDVNTKETQLEEVFNARFACKSRTYRYFFRSNNLNLEKMKEACNLLEGEHDFRNFCKIDLSNQRSFKRTIESCKILRSEFNPGVSYCQIKGSSFLWHQIRLIMAVLFHIGAELEQPSIVSELLDIDKNPARPSFAMAAELPLLLYGSEYDGLEWQFSERNITKIRNKLNQRLGEDLVRCELTQTFLKVLSNPPFPTNIPLDDIDHIECSSLAKRKKHRPFMKREQCKGVDERKTELKHLPPMDEVDE